MGASARVSTSEIDVRVLFLCSQNRLRSPTAEMVFDVADLIVYLARHFTLEAGDVILTGTPDGVGAFRDPPAYLVDGDDVILQIGSINVQQSPHR